MRIVVQPVDYDSAIKTLDEYLGDISVNDEGKLEGMPDLEELLDQILLDLGLDKE